jgi:hypothetical protein
MRYSVCVIDNDIPAAGPQAQEFGVVDTDLLNASNLRLLLQNERWGDEILKSLIAKLLRQRDDDGVSPKWEVFAFTNPSFYINAINDGFFRSDLIVFDWEYPGAQNRMGLNSEGTLKEILERTFCLVFIFSKADKKEEIEAILAKPEFQQFKERLRYLDKATPEGDQTDTLLQNADRMYAENFSFKFAGELRRRSVQCADQVLADMGRASLNDVKNLLVVGDGGKKDLIDFLAERFRTAIASRKIYDLVDQIPASTVPLAIDADLASKVWSYRLYFQQEPGDDLVRRGDIVALGTEVLLVLSADCDLARFWLKNLGVINAVSLHELDHTNMTLMQMLTLCLKPEDLRSNIGSLLGKIGALTEGPFLLPFVPKGEGFKNFVAIPKDLVSRRVPTPAEWERFSKNQKKDHSMTYTYWAGARRLCTISEPFLTPVVQHIFNAIGGNGVPDYPDHMKQILKQILEDFAKTPATAAVVATTPPVLPAPVPAVADRIAVLPEIVAAIAASVTATPLEFSVTQTVPQEIAQSACDVTPIPAVPAEQSTEPAV